MLDRPEVRLEEEEAADEGDKGGSKQMIDLKDRWTSVTDRERWLAHGASFVAKLKATRTVWFPPEPVKGGITAAAETKTAATSAARSTTEKATSAPSKATGKAPGKATKKAAKKTSKKPATKATRKTAGTARSTAKGTAKKTAKKTSGSTKS